MTAPATTRADRRSDVGDAVFRVPPTAYFLVSAVFHYLGPAFAVLLFAHVDVLGVAWLRIASAAVVLPSGADRGAAGPGLRPPTAACCCCSGPCWLR